MNNTTNNDTRETTRIEAFSDGVIAIAVTILVFDLRAPAQTLVDNSNLWTELVRVWPTWLAFVISFFYVLVMWINHHRLFTVIRRSDNNLMLLNGLLLFGISVVPVPTRIAAEYLQHRDQNIAALIYSGWFFVVAIFYQLLWRYASHGNRLFASDTDMAVVRQIDRSYFVGPIGYTIALIVATFSAVGSMLIVTAMGVFFALPNPLMQRLMSGEKIPISSE